MLHFNATKWLSKTFFLKISYAKCFCPIEIWVKKITLTCLPSADWCCREPIVAGPNKGDKKVDPGTTPRVCPCLWSKAWSDSKSRRDKWVLTPYMHVQMYIDTLMYGHPASRLAFHFMGGSRGRVRGVRPPPPWDDLRFSNTTGILPKKKLCGLLVLK